MTNAPFLLRRTSPGTVYALDERTARFGENCIAFCMSVRLTPITSPLVNQLIRSSTSIGANYMEADGAESKKDFRHKIGICKKEAKETLHWLRMIAQAEEQRKSTCRTLWKEAHELVLIFSSVLRK